MIAKRKGKYVFFLHLSADRGIISAARRLLYILGVSERTDKLVRELVLDDAAPFVPLVKTKRGQESTYEAKTVTLPSGTTSSAATTPTENVGRAAARRRLQFPLGYLLVSRTVEEGRDMGTNHGGIERLHQMCRGTERGKRVEEQLEDGWLAQPLEPLPRAVPSAEALRQRSPGDDAALPEQPIATALDAASRQRRAEHAPAACQSSSVIAVDLPTLRYSRQSMNHIECRRGTLNHLPTSIPPYGLGEHNG